MNPSPLIPSCAKIPSMRNLPVCTQTCPNDAHDLSIRIYYADTDAAGVVYYTNYLRFCEAGRTEWLRSRELDLIGLARDEDLIFVVRSVQANYRVPAVLDDEIIVRTQLGELGGASLVFRQQILRAGIELFNATVTVACASERRRKPTPIPEHLRQTLTATQEKI